MKISLEPIPPLTGDAIEVRGDLFAIGRSEPPFRDMSRDVVSQLSRRHARLFEEQGQLYLVDLGSRNGTRLNGRLLADQPQAVGHLDELRFGNLSYRIQAPAQRAAPVAGPAPTLTLRPRAGPTGSTLMITEFPCLIGKNTGIIAEYCQRFAIEPRYLSRRHAHIYRGDGGLCLEDLGSTNGSFVNGERVEERAHRLCSGDLLQFGSDAELAFDCAIAPADEPATAVLVRPPPPVSEPVPEPGADASPRRGQPAGDPEAGSPDGGSPDGGSPDGGSPDGGSPAAGAAAPEPPAPAQAPGSTILMDKANTFLNIFCDEPEDSPPPGTGPSGEGRPAREPAARAEAAGRRRSLGRWASVLAGATAAALIIAGSAYYVSANRPEARAQRLLDAGDYAGAAALANAALDEDPESETLRALSSEASIHWLVPAWLQALEGGDFAAARLLVTQTAAPLEANPDMTAIIALLAGATDLEALMADMDQGDSVQIYGNEERIREILDSWEQNPLVIARSMDLLAEQVPAFRATRRQLRSHLRELQASQSIYLDAIDRLKRELDEELERDELAAAAARVQRFGLRYPRVQGLDALLADLARYGEWRQLLENREVLTLLARRRAEPLATPLVERHAQRSIDGELPPAAVVENYELAQGAWAAGDAATAIATLNALTEGAWGDVAETMLADYQRVDTAYNALLARGEESDPGEALLVFYGSLDPKRDSYYLQQLEARYAPLREEALAGARASLSGAEASWQRYRAAGGITSIMRLRDRLDDGYRQRSAELGEAYRLAGLAHLRLQSLAPEEAGPSLETLEAIRGELRLQRQNLNSLREALGEELTRQKLALLPDPTDSGERTTEEE